MSAPRSSPVQAADEAVWERYWSAERIAACLDRQAPNYPGRLHDDWARFFSELAPGSKVLDVATGNGAIPAIGAEVSRERALGLSIHGIDSAAIDPRRFAGNLLGDMDGVTFHSRTPAEDLPFADASFDATTGQYALEYTDTRRAIAELARVLRPGAACRFILHARQGVVWDATWRQLDQARRLIQGQDIFHTLTTLVTGELSATARGPDCERQKRAFQAQSRKLLHEASVDGDTDLVTNVLSILAEIYQHRRDAGLDATLQALEQARRDLCDHVARLHALAEAALDRQGVQELGERMESVGFTGMTCSVATDSRELQVGWCLQGQRAQA